MALDKTRWGNSIAAKIKALGVAAGSVITDAQLEATWQAMADASKSEINTNADIQLVAGDLLVPGAGLNSPAGPVTGTANIQNMTPIPGRIK